MVKNNGILTRAKHFYSKTLCNCDDGNSVVECTVVQTMHRPKNDNVVISSSKDDNAVISSPKEIDNCADLQDLMRLISMRKGGGGATVDVDSDGNLVWRKPAAAAGLSYGGRVGRIGRIDEDKTCCFSEADVNRLLYSKSGNINSINMRRVTI